MGRGSERPGAVGLRVARLCWKDLVPTGMNPTLPAFCCRDGTPQRIAERNSNLSDQASLRRRPCGRSIRFPWPPVGSTTSEKGVDQQALDRNQASEAGKTCTGAGYGLSAAWQDRNVHLGRNFTSKPFPRTSLDPETPDPASFYTGCQKRLPKCRARKRRVQGVRWEWMNILDRGITQEPGFPRRNLNSHARAAARVPFPQLSHFRKNFWQSVYGPGYGISPCRGPETCRSWLWIKQSNAFSSFSQHRAPYLPTGL